MKRVVENKNTTINKNFISMKWIDNPHEKLFEILPSIKNRFYVTIEEFWSETYQNRSILIYGENDLVNSVYEEILRAITTVAAH
ncbi:MAG TPA: hypothetical protein ENN22_12620 [bacterium]|nr:hypothetical protein [bacterium]